MLFNFKSMKKYYLIFSLLLLLFALESFAQEKKPARFHVELDFHHNLGLRERCDWWTLKRDNYWKMRGNALHLILLYHINSRVSAGAGIGIDGYKEPSYNTFPIFGTVRYRPLKKFLDPYLYTNLGYGLGKNEHANIPGWMWDAGIGYTKMFRRYFGLNCQFGYNFKDFSNVVSAIDDKGDFYDRRMHMLRHSLSFGFGLVF